MRRGSVLLLVTTTLFGAIGCSSTGVGSAPSEPTASVPPSPAASRSAVPPSPSAAFDCEEETTGCAGPLAAGEHRSVHFDHPFTFTVPSGWTNGRDIYRAYTLRAAAAPDAEFIVWSYAAPAEQTPDCSPARREGFGTSVSEWMRSLNTDDRLDFTVKDTFQLGSHAATPVDVKAKSTFNVICEGNSDPFAVLVTDTEIPPTRHHGANGTITFVDFGDDAIVIWNDGIDTTGRPMFELSLPVIQSIRFDD